MKLSNPLMLCVVLAAACAAAGNDQEGAQARRPALAFYTFAELLAKAERIVIAEVGPEQDGASVLLVRETLKAPENDPKAVEPELMKRAAELLANDKLELPPLKPPASLRAKAENLRLPAEGTQAIFFLWDKLPGDAKPGPAYRVAHPQCVYEIELLEQVRAGVARPRSVADGRYLREWDKQMAARARQRQANEALLKMKGGDPVMGLRVRALRPTLSLRGDNSFAITVRVENTRSREQLIYDGPGGGYGVLIRPKNASGDMTRFPAVREVGIVSPEARGLALRQASGSSGTDSTVLNLADETDFTSVRGDSFVPKELFFDAKEFPALRRLEGAFTVAVFFSTEQDGRGLELAGPVWTGVMVSEEVPLQFPVREAQAKLPEP